MSFEEMSWTEKFDGIWACASLLHLPKTKLPNIFEILLKALKTDGIMYVSFKEGKGEAIKNGRFFSYYSDEELKNILQNLRSNEITKCWIGSDVRRSSQKQKWINLLIKRT